MSSTIHQAQQSSSRLAQFESLDAEVLRNSVRQGEAERATCTENDPRIFAGMVPWAKTVRTLRESLVARGWRREEPGNLPLIVSPDGTMAIAVSSGDEYTGVASGTPQTQYPKGPVTIAAVGSNQLSLALFGQTPSAAAASADGPAWVLWFLLIANRGNELRCELSLPDQIGDDLRVTGWVERIILDPIVLDQVPAFTTPEVEPPIAVDVRRKV